MSQLLCSVSLTKDYRSNFVFIFVQARWSPFQTRVLCKKSEKIDSDTFFRRAEKLKVDIIANTLEIMHIPSHFGFDHKAYHLHLGNDKVDLQPILTALFLHLLKTLDFLFSGPSMSLSNNSIHQIYWSDLPVFFIVKNVCRSNFQVFFTVRKNSVPRTLDTNLVSKVPRPNK